MRRVVFVDLDDTLFQTARKQPATEFTAALDRHGQPLSFQSHRQRAFFDWLGGDACLIPVTGRTVAAFRRVLLPFPHWVVCSFGGVILRPDGELHPAWHERMAAATAGVANTLKQLEAATAALAAARGVDARWKIVHDAELPLYLSIKHNHEPAGNLAPLAAGLADVLPPRWTLHHNDANMALLPPFLGKERAVAFLLDELTADSELLAIGVGDSLTDGGFMALCDYAIAPARSQIITALLAGLATRGAPA